MRIGRWAGDVSTLFARVFIAVFCVTALSVFLAAYLNYAKFEGVYTRVEADRFQVVSTDIVASLENELDLGIPLARMTSAERVLEEAARRARGMSGAVVFDVTGSVVFTAGVPLAQGVVPADWLTPDGDGGFSGLTGETRVVGSQLVNNFGRTVGGVAVGYAAQSGQSVVQRVGLSLGIGSLIVVLGVFLTCSVGLRWLTRGVSMRVHTVAQALRGGGADADTDAGLREETRRVAAADAEAAIALRELKCAEKRLGRLAEKV